MVKGPKVCETRGAPKPELLVEAPGDEDRPWAQRGFDETWKALSAMGLEPASDDGSVFSREPRMKMHKDPIASFLAGWGWTWGKIQRGTGLPLALYYRPGALGFGKKGRSGFEDCVLGRDYFDSKDALLQFTTASPTRE